MLLDGEGVHGGVDFAGSRAGGGERVGVGERCAELLGGVVGLGAAPGGLVEGVGVALVQSGQSVLEPADEAGGVGVAQLLEIQADLFAGDPGDGQGDFGAVLAAYTTRGDGEPA